MKHVTALILSLLLMLSLAACGTPNTPVPESTTEAAAQTTAKEEETETPRALDSLEKQDFGGHVFRIHYPGVDKCYTDFYATEVTGEVLNDAVLARNNAVCSKFNISLDIDWRSDNSAVTDEITKQFTSGEQTYDMFGGHRNCLYLSYGGYLYDFTKLSAISLDEVWWDSNWVDAMTINGSLYFAAGDISADTLLYVSSLTFNKKLVSDNGLAYPYELARSGNWTYEELYRMTAEYGQDLNSDGKMTPGDDIYSIIGWHYESAYSLFYGSGFTFLNRDGEGTYRLEFDNTRLDDIMTNINRIWTTPHAYMRLTTGDAEHESLYRIFADGQAMFSDIVLVKIGWFYRDMADDFGIVPIPKVTADQPEYHSYTGYTIPIACFCRNAEDPERTGTLIEAFARASYDIVTPQMYEIVTKSRNVRDADSAQMIEIIYRHKIFDAAHYFNLNTFGTLPSTQLQKDNAGLAGTVKNGQKVASKEWNKIQSAYDDLKK